jgi:DNA invertase Pin-like site-specific DNA recombinase
MVIDLRGREAAAYVRVSDDKAAGSDLEGTSGEGQEDEAYEVAAEYGLHLPEARIFNDNDIGASSYSRKKRRDEWDKLLRCMEAGAVSVLIMWECSRGTRRHLEWANFLDLIERRHILVYAINKGRALDPRDPGDWEILAQEGVKATSEANQISTRVRRGVRKARRKGRPLGMPPFGWRSEYNDKTGKMITWLPVPGKIEIVQEMYRRFVAGETLHDIARDLNRRADLPEGDPDRAPLTKQGKHWQITSVRSVLATPTHIGKFWGAPDENGRRKLVDGAWEGVVDEEHWWSAHSILTSPERKHSRPTKAKYLLSGIARCAECGSKMGYARNVKADPMYRCRGMNDDHTPMPRKRQPGDMGPKHAMIKMEWLDDHVRDEVIDRMCVEGLIEDLTAESSEEQAAAGAKAAEIRADIAAMGALVQSRDIRPAEFADFRATWEPEAARLEEAASAGREAGAVIVLGLLREAREAGVADLKKVLLRAWEDIPLQGRKDTIRALTKSVRVFPGRRGARSFDSSRVEIL